MHELKFNKWLMAVQCAFGPLFCTAVLFSTSVYLEFLAQCEKILTPYTEGFAYERLLLLGIGLAGLAAGISVALFADKGDHRGWLQARCSMGFLVAVVWIMAIADEVVNILQVSKANMAIRGITEHWLDLRLHFWAVGRDHWSDDICRRKLDC
jgi:sodium/potassium/calcium exchanger 6